MVARSGPPAYTFPRGENEDGKLSRFSGGRSGAVARQADLATLSSRDGRQGGAGARQAAAGGFVRVDQFWREPDPACSGGYSALRHAHGKQDEFIYVLEGEPTLVTDSGETPLKPGMCAGFKCGTGDAHHLVNRTKKDVVFLEVGDRSVGDSVSYPDDDVVAVFGSDGKWKYSKKDATPTSRRSRPPRGCPRGSAGRSQRLPAAPGRCPGDR